MNVKAANWRDLLDMYYSANGASRAADEILAHIQANSSGKLARLLRDHRVETVSSRREIAFRDRTDALLNCCSVLEIASLAAFIETPPQEQLWSRLRTILEHESVRQYYTNYYPIRLPQLLLARLQGRHSAVEPDSPTVNSLMMAFLSLDRRFVTTLADSYLLPMLDHFTDGNGGFQDVVLRIQDPERFITRLLLPENEREIADVALHELNAFIHFSHDLQRLLDRAAEYPLLQSELWHHYGYWYGSIGDRLRTDLDYALDQFRDWIPKGDQKDTAHSIQQELARAKAVIHALTSPRYAKVVDSIPA